MSYESLLAIEEMRVFDATRRFEDLDLYHVPFDELNGDGRTEETLARLSGARSKIAVIGPSGCGKSSVLSYVLGPLAPGVPPEVVPLRVPVAAADDDIVTDPGSMARYIVRYVTRWASPEQFTSEQRKEFEAGVADITRRRGSVRARKFHLALPVWLADAGFASELQATGDEFESRAEGADALEYLNRMIAQFEANSLWPVFVFDDSDAWLRIEGLDRSAVADEFFLRSFRMLAKDVDVGVVLAVHDQYRDLEGYRQAAEWLSGEVVIPRLMDAQASIARLLWDRLVISEIEVSSLPDVFEDEAVQQIAKFYDTGRGMRDILRVSQRALQNALSDRFDVVTAPLVEQAISELAH
jgi:hypothetical protein